MVHDKHLVVYYSEEKSLSAMIEDYVPPDQRHDDFHERISEQRFGKKVLQQGTHRWLHPRLNLLLQSGQLFQRKALVVREVIPELFHFKDFRLHYQSANQLHSLPLAAERLDKQP